MISTTYDVKNLPFQGSNRGSNPRGDAISKSFEIARFPRRYDGFFQLLASIRFNPEQPVTTQNKPNIGEKLVNDSVHGGVL